MSLTPFDFLYQSKMRPTNGEISVTLRLRARHRLSEAEEQRQVAVDALLLEDSAAALDAFPGARDLDQHALAAAPALARRASISSARLLDAWPLGVEADSTASTSVETRPGMIFRISEPKLTASLSMNARGSAPRASPVCLDE